MKRYINAAVIINSNVILSHLLISFKDNAIPVSGKIVRGIVFGYAYGRHFGPYIRFGENYNKKRYLQFNTRCGKTFLKPINRLIMKKLLLEALLQIAILIPFALLLLKEKSKMNYLRIAAFVFCYVVYQIVLMLPALNPLFDCIKGRWNWDGKLYGICWAVISYFLFRKLFQENDFFTLQQNKAGLKPALRGAAGLVLLSVIIWFILGKSAFNAETLAFQISLPGMDEEMIFRGIGLGLLTTALKNKTWLPGNPSVWLTAVLFGLMHALTISKNYAVDFDPFYFIQTGLAGYVWGWVTIRSRSIVLAVLSHNLSNFLGTLATMIK